MTRLLPIVALIAAVSCANLPMAAPTPLPDRRFYPDDVTAVPLPITPTMERWWGEVEACTGGRADIRAFRFYLWADTVFQWDGLPLDGLYRRDTKQVFVRQYDPKIIRHEMAHPLVPWDSGRHAAWVGEACGSILRWP